MGGIAPGTARGGGGLRGCTDMAEDSSAGGGAGSGVQWETYPDCARLLGMKVESFRRLALRGRPQITALHRFRRGLEMAR